MLLHTTKNANIEHFNVIIWYKCITRIIIIIIITIPDTPVDILAHRTGWNKAHWRFPTNDDKMKAFNAKLVMVRLVWVFIHKINLYERSRPGTSSTACHKTGHDFNEDGTSQKIILLVNRNFWWSRASMQQIMHPAELAEMTKQAKYYNTLLKCSINAYHPVNFWWLSNDKHMYTLLPTVF
jgi:hypothetical protein